jgi:hypothetical protein
MSEPLSSEPPVAARRRRGPSLRPRSLWGVLLACAAVAAVLAVALDQYLVHKRKQRARAEILPPDRNAIPAPTLGLWVPAPLPAGSPAPPFRLRDVRTGQAVSLGDYRGRKPVVLLLSSFG